MKLDNYDRNALRRLLSFCKRDENGCLIYMGALTKGGYGKFYYKELTVLAHRIHMFLIGKLNSLDNPLLVLHKNFICKSRTCIEEEHLYIGTYKENNNDTTEKGHLRFGVENYNSSKTHCGTCKLPLEGINLIKDGRHRHCRNCKNKRNRETMARKREEKAKRLSMKGQDVTGKNKITN